MMIEKLKIDLHAQQGVMTSFCNTNDDVSYEVSKWIAKKLNPYDDEGWAKELLVKAAEKLAPKSVYLYQKLSLSRLTVCESTNEMGQDIEDDLKKKLMNLLTSACVLMKQRTSRTLGSWQYFLRDNIRF